MSNQTNQEVKVDNGEQKEVASIENDWAQSLYSKNSNSGGSRGLAMTDDVGKCDVSATKDLVVVTASGRNARAAAVCEQFDGCFLM